ncbi:Uncharacterised protein [Salmonella enterica subsp. enterica]|uniref:Uncharacterized protein n=1 Tax=Salmonella enterica I TaxID=59201 RepID=A0A447TUT8_SALET|nr:Uncharacterised protein [Salmonella enterica subsp. enterica]
MKSSCHSWPVCGESRKFITPGENNFALIYYYWWGSEIAIALEFDANGSRITANPKAENLTIADAFFDEHGEALAEELYNKQGFILIPFRGLVKILPDENSSSGSFNYWYTGNKLKLDKNMHQCVPDRQIAESVQSSVYRPRRGISGCRNVREIYVPTAQAQWPPR